MLWTVRTKRFHAVTPIPSRNLRSVMMCSLVAATPTPEDRMSLKARNEKSMASKAVDGAAAPGRPMAGLASVVNQDLIVFVSFTL